MQINPKIESKSIKNTYAYMTLINYPDATGSVVQFLDESIPSQTYDQIYWF